MARGPGGQAAKGGAAGAPGGSAPANGEAEVKVARAGKAVRKSFVRRRELKEKQRPRAVGAQVEAGQGEEGRCLSLEGLMSHEDVRQREEQGKLQRRTPVSEAGQYCAVIAVSCTVLCSWSIYA